LLILKGIPIIPMKLKYTLLPLLTAASFSHAGEPVPETDTPDVFKPLSTTLDIRTRYEFREVDGQDPSHAWTTRARIGLKTADFSFELNRAWVQYNKHGFLAKVGRQRIIRNNAAFIGNVGWRQNEQTFDAIQLGYKTDAFSINYVYSDRAQRIFGTDANDAAFSGDGPPLSDFEGDFHFLDATYKVGEGTLGGYVYLIDVENNNNVGESNTVGVFYKGNGLHAELAYQDGESIYTHKVGKSAFSVGVEYLEEGFKTPFATVHAFNGYADAFILQRFGLNNAGGNYEGLTDFRVGFTQAGLPGNMTFKLFGHYFLDDSLSDSYGWEVDAVLVKPINKNLKAILKAAYFNADDDAAGYSDIKQVSLGFNYSY